MSPRRSLRARATMRSNLQKPVSNRRTRSTRLTRTSSSPPSVTVSRSSPEKAQKSLLLIIKMPSGKLREATSGSSRAASKRNVFTEDPIVMGPRTSRPQKKMVEIDTSEEEGLSDQEEDDVDDEDAPGDEDEDADADADGDLDMDDAPPQPPTRRHARAAAKAKPSRKQMKSVEAKEMELENGGDNYDEEELSDLDDSDAEGEPGDDRANGGAEFDEDDLDDAGEDEEGLDSDDETGENSGKMTKRQRRSLGDDFLQLPMGEF